MALTIYFEGVDSLPNLPIIRDVVKLFAKVRIDGCAYDRTILKRIEQGSYRDELFFTDRFDSKVRIDCLSTGTKAALSLYHCPDMIISGIELGNNALTEIVIYCNCGRLLLPAHNYYVAGKIGDRIIDVECRGRHYTSLNTFAEYMMEDAPYD